MDFPSLFGWLDKYPSIMCLILLILITVSISCGTSNSENNSYLVQSSCTSCTSPCKYKICPVSTSVCRIRYDFSVSKSFAICTDGSRILHTLLIKHYNDLLDRQSSERGKDEVTYFYVGDVFCIHLGTKYADFQEKIFAEISGKMFRTLGIT